MSTPSKDRFSLPPERDRWDAAFADAGLACASPSAKLRSRTHRVVRERALSRQASRSRVRSLWIPLAISACFTLLLSLAVWSVFDGNESSTTAVPDPGSQMFVLLMWCLPVTIAVLAVVWARLNSRAHDEGAR